MTRHVLTIALAAALAVAALPAAASTFVWQSPGDMVAGADAVIIGEVLETYSFWTGNPAIIATEAVVHVHDVVLGDAPAMLNVRTYGGTVGHYRIEAHGFPAFQAGERQLLFLHRAEDGTVRVTAFQQGQFRVQRGTDGREMAVPMTDAAAAFVRSDGQPVPAAAALPLADLVNQIRGLDRRNRRPLEQ